MAQHWMTLEEEGENLSRAGGGARGAHASSCWGLRSWAVVRGTSGVLAALSKQSLHQRTSGMKCAGRGCVDGAQSAELHCSEGACHIPSGKKDVSCSAVPAEHEVLRESAFSEVWNSLPH